MSKHDSSLDLPALSADESGGNMTDSSTVMNNNNEPSQHEQQLPAPNSSYIDSNFFYSLDQLSQDNSLFFMPQQQQQPKGQHFGNQFINQNASRMNEGVGNQSLIATSMESFHQAITGSVGDQPPSFWSGLNNFISNVTSNVTHNNLFPAFPNIARSFSEYLEKHPVPFLSSFNAQNDSPIASPMPHNPDFDPMLQFKQEHGQSNTGLQIRVLGVPQTGAKSRVETQIKLCIQLVTDGGNKAQWWSHLKLPDQMVTKDKLKKPSNNTSEQIVEDPARTLYLQAQVLCASDPSRKVITCLGCIQRERKRSQRRKETKSAAVAATQQESEGEDDLVTDEERILLFNCSEMVDFNAGDTILPTRITCYCRHHNERVGFCIYFEMLDHTGKRVAEGISPPIMITDDHKSNNKVKIGSKRRRATESEVEPPVPLSEGGILALNWIKSFQFGGGSNKYIEPKIEQQDHYPPTSSALPTTSEYKPIHPLQQLLFSEPPPPPPPPLQQQQQQPEKPALMKRLIPNEAPANGGIEITILGTDFRPGLTVLFGDKPATNIQYWSPNTLICTLPPATHPGAVVVSFKESPPPDKTDVLVFTYLVETDRALLELALQVVGLKTMGKVQDARQIALSIVQGNTSGIPQIKAEEASTQHASSSSSSSASFK